ncbi:hypothetical protein LTR86_000589 [Recurvomyces mirabilis]|nr:hypothetical protein LTR86_000589 [Recurvomyces mirabilis]
MAHRQLAEKYASQLNEANKRALEYESIIADLEDRRTEASSAQPDHSQNSMKEVQQLRHQLVTALNHIAEHERTIKNQARECELAKNMADAADVAVAAVNTKMKSMQSQLAVAQDASAADANSTQGQGGIDRGDSVAAAMPELRKQLTQAKANNQALVADLAQANIDVRAATKAEREAVFSLDKVKQNLKAAQSKSKGLTTANKKVKAQFKATEDALVVHEERVAELSTVCELEKRRRLDAENMLGPDGKRCRKCDPEVVDLMDEK